MPNWRKDRKKSRRSEGRCSIAGCPREQAITYYDYGLCNVCFDYYFDDDKPSAFLDKVLGLPVSAAEYERAVRTYNKEQLEKREAAKKAEEAADEDKFDRRLIADLKRRETRAKKKRVDRTDE